MNMPLLLSNICDLNTGFNWGEIGSCFISSQGLGLDLSWVLILVFFVLMVLMGNLRIGVWYSIASVLTLFFLVSNPGNDVVFFLWLFVTILIPALMLIPAFKKIVGGV